MLKEKYPDSKAALPVMVVNVDESALLSAIKFNSGHANWVIEDYIWRKVFMSSFMTLP